jgi:thiamine kinase-like enzyme
MFERIDTKYKKLTVSGELYDLLKKSFQYVKSIQTRLQDLTVSLAPCHNDLNPGNIFVHNDQVTFIDWGDAALGNPYYDIAAFFVLNVIEAENQKLFFEHYDKKLLSPEWQAYMHLCKQVVYFEFALNLLGGVQAGKNELLHAIHIPEVQTVNYYLTRLAARDVEIDSIFLYSMALASVNKISHEN